MDTTQGRVAVKEVGEKSGLGGTFVALGGLGRRGMGPDWLRAGIPQMLADKGWRVLLPDPYSCPKTRPTLGEVRPLFKNLSHLQFSPQPPPLTSRSLSSHEA